MENIDDLGSINIANLDDLRPVLTDRDSQDDKLAGRELTLRQVLDVDDLDELVQLFDTLVQLLRVPFYSGRYPGEIRIVGGTDIEGVDVESAPTEHPRHAGENAEVILNQD